MNRMILGKRRGTELSDTPTSPICPKAGWNADSFRIHRRCANPDTLTEQMSVSQRDRNFELQKRDKPQAAHIAWAHC